MRGFFTGTASSITSRSEKKLRASFQAFRQSRPNGDASRLVQETSILPCMRWEMSARRLTLAEPSRIMMTRSNTTKARILSPLWRSRPWRLSSPRPPEPFPSPGLRRLFQIVLDGSQLRRLCVHFHLPCAALFRERVRSEYTGRK